MHAASCKRSREAEEPAPVLGVVLVLLLVVVVLVLPPRWRALDTAWRAEEAPRSARGGAWRSGVGVPMQAARHREGIV